MEVQPRDILLRISPKMLERYNALAVAGAGRGRVKPLPYTFTRAAPSANYIDRDSTLRLAGVDVPRIEWVDLDGDGVRETPGILLEGSRTNIVLHNRDLTNAAWTKTSVTAVKDQTGIDGVVNSASKITADAANGTCLQAITLASSARFQSAYVKRITGSGTVQMTMDNGTNWTNITVTSAFTRVTIPTQTLANPTVGFRIVTSGDAIAVDYVQNENGVFQSSGIATTTAAVTRAADSLSVGFNFGPMDLTVLARVARPVHADVSGALGVDPSIVGIASTGSLKLLLTMLSSIRNILVRALGTSGLSDRDVSIPTGTELRFLAQYKDFPNPAVAVDVGSGLSAFGTGATGFTAFGNQTIQVGAGLNELYGVLLDLILARGLRTRAEMLAASDA